MRAELGAEGTREEWWPVGQRQVGECVRRVQGFGEHLVLEDQQEEADAAGGECALGEKARPGLARSRSPCHVKLFQLRF